MQLDITHLIGSDNFVPFDISNNASTLGAEAAQLTWNAAKEAAHDIVPPLLDTDEKRQEFRDWVKDFGAWDDEEIAAWDDEELNALLLQFIAGDIREAFGDDPPDEWDWEEYQRDAESGRISGRLFKSGDDVYFYLGN